MMIVAELSANHNQDLSLAKESIYAIKECGAGAVKFQTYTPDSLTLDCKNDFFKIKSASPWKGKYLYDLYKEAYMPLEWHYELFSLAAKLDLICFSSVFDEEGLELLESINNPIYKIASFEITDIPLIKKVAKCKKPIILSSGIAMGDDLQEAINAIREENNFDITLLKCISSYPASLDSMNLLEMVENGIKYDVKYGLSDHSLGNEAAIIATTLKASVIEKHFILDKKYGGVDSAFSLDRNEFFQFVKNILDAKKALGEEYEIKLEAISRCESRIEKEPKGREFSRSLFVCKNIKKGQELSLENIKSIRPSYGAKPKYLPLVLGKKAKKDLFFGEPLNLEDIEI